MAIIKAGQSVYKYQLQVADVQRIDLPVGAQVLRIELQRGMVALWAVVDPSASSEERTVHCIGTGHRFTTGSADYIGTVQLHGGSLVFHYFIQ